MTAWSACPPSRVGGGISRAAGVYTLGAEPAVEPGPGERYVRSAGLS